MGVVIFNAREAPRRKTMSFWRFSRKLMLAPCAGASIEESRGPRKRFALHKLRRKLLFGSLGLFVRGDGLGLGLLRFGENRCGRLGRLGAGFFGRRFGIGLGV